MEGKRQGSTAAGLWFSLVLPRCQPRQTSRSYQRDKPGNGIMVLWYHASLTTADMVTHTEDTQLASL